MRRGKSKGKAIWYTILLWVGMEFWGMFSILILLVMFDLYEELNVLLYLFALIYAGLGGYIALLFSRMHAVLHRAYPEDDDVLIGMK